MARWLVTAAVVLLVSCAGTEEQAATPPLKVFVLAGQSNMYGGGHVSRLPDDLRYPQQDAWFFHDGRWLPVAPRTIQEGFGPELSFARHMTAALGEPIGIIKLSPGGTNLAEQWSPQNPGSLYHQLLEQVRTAQADRPIQIAGMLWVQGEADARYENFGPRYQRNLENFIRRTRQDYGAPEMPFIAGRVNPPADWPGGPIFHWRDDVRKGIENADVPRYRYINLDDIPKREDNLHYTSEGQIIMGERLAVAMLEMMDAK